MNPTRVELKGRNQHFKQAVFFLTTYSHHGTHEPWGVTSKVVEESLQIGEHRKPPVRKSY